MFSSLLLVLLRICSGVDTVEVSDYNVNCRNDMNAGTCDELDFVT